jgi:hypothetical protein
MKSLILLSTLALPVLALTPQERGLEIAKQVEKANDGFIGEQAQMEMVLYNAHGDKVIRRMLSKTQETATDGDRAISTFAWPADVKGTRMLTWTHKKGDDDQWLFLPAIKRVKRISSRNKSGSFMGSEFAYEDLGSQEPEKFKHKHLKDLEQGEGKDKRKLWLLEQIPTYRSGYSKMVLWMDQIYMGPVRIDYYDRKGELLKTSEFTGYKKYGKYWRPGAIEIKNHQTRKRSIVRWKNRALFKKFTEDEFDSENLDEED